MFLSIRLGNVLSCQLSILTLRETEADIQREGPREVQKENRRWKETCIQRKRDTDSDAETDRERHRNKSSDRKKRIYKERGTDRQRLRPSGTPVTECCRCAFPPSSFPRIPTRCRRTPPPLPQLVNIQAVGSLERASLAFEWPSDSGAPGLRQAGETGPPLANQPPSPGGARRG